MSFADALSGLFTSADSTTNSGLHTVSGFVIHGVFPTGMPKAQAQALGQVFHPLLSVRDNAESLVQKSSATQRQSRNTQDETVPPRCRDSRYTSSICRPGD